MYISDEHRLIFFHVRKTGGNSVVSAIKTGDRHSHPLSPSHGRMHETVEEFCARVGAETFKSYTSFCFVRDPLSRFISQYRFMLGRTEKIPFMQTVKGVRQFIDAIREDIQLKVLLPGGDVKIEGMATLARPQREYTRLGDIDVAVNHVFRQETMRRDWPDICAMLGIPLAPLQDINRSEQHPIDDMDAAHEFVSNYYRRDCEVFGYAPSLQTA